MDKRIYQIFLSVTFASYKLGVETKNRNHELFFFLQQEHFSYWIWKTLINGWIHFPFSCFFFLFCFNSIIIMSRSFTSHPRFAFKILNILKNKLPDET